LWLTGRSEGASLNALRARRVAIGLAAFAIYLGAWLFRREVGIVQPMANLRYFYYGAAPCSLSDSVLYWGFSPAYKPWLAIQRVRTGGYPDDVHWSDGWDGGKGYEHLCSAGRRLGV
jgi:hypothetical protein